MSTHNLDYTDGAWHPTGADPQLVVDIEARPEPLCVRVSLDTDGAAELEIFLRDRDDAGPRFVAGRSVRQRLSEGAGQTLTFVLPADFVQDQFRLDPGDGASDSVIVRSLEIGRLHAAAGRPGVSM